MMQEGLLTQGRFAAGTTQLCRHELLVEELDLEPRRTKCRRKPGVLRVLLCTARLLL
jgi:hypothetical protein